MKDAKAVFDFLVDSHCHLNYEGLAHDQKGAVERALGCGVGAMLSINTKLREYDEIIAIVEAYPQVWGTVGIHPHEAENEAGVAVETLVKLSAHDKIVGLGETGLDYFYENAPKKEQEDNFRSHILASQQTGLPVVIHTRDADEDCEAILREHMADAPFKAVVHCFTAGPGLAAAALELGLYISISGIVTFKNAVQLRDIVKTIPAERLLVETDSPFLAPVPHRGKTCEPAYVADTAAFIANLREEDFNVLKRQTSANFFRLFDKIDVSAIAA